jgi:hypothetical protein
MSIFRNDVKKKFELETVYLRLVHWTCLIALSIRVVDPESVKYVTVYFLQQQEEK